MYGAKMRLKITRVYYKKKLDNIRIVYFLSHEPYSLMLLDRSSWIGSTNIECLSYSNNFYKNGSFIYVYRYILIFKHCKWSLQINTACVIAFLFVPSISTAKPSGRSFSRQHNFPPPFLILKQTSLPVHSYSFHVLLDHILQYYPRNFFSDRFQVVIVLVPLSLLLSQTRPIHCVLQTPMKFYYFYL